ncbi:hypothetical protein [Herbaspirillum huttiense]|uniref:hypothetical protein n=1 Tax=Herbaspirillum huttiense TaxID=863372 RepID=UPI0031DC0FAF
MTNKVTGAKVASTAGRTLGSTNSSVVQRSLAGSALAQTGTSKTTGKAMETTASNALNNPRSSSTTKTLAGSLISQSKKSR